MALLKAPNPRRRDLRSRRGMAKDVRPRNLSLTSREVLCTALSILGFTLAATFIACLALERPVYRVGQLVDRTIVARVSFQAVDHGETESQRRTEAAKALPVYGPNDRYFNQLEAALEDLGEFARTHASTAWGDIPEDRRRGLDADSFRQLRQIVSRDDGKGWVQPTLEFINLMRSVKPEESVVVLNEERMRIDGSLHDGPGRILIKLPDGTLHTFSQSGLFSREDPRLRRRVDEHASKVFRSPELAAYIRSLTLQLLTTDTYVFDQALTEAQQQFRRDQVEDVVITVQPHAVLVEAGRHIDRRDMAMLELEQEAYLQELGPVLWIKRGGVMSVALAIAIGIWGYIWTYQPRIFYNPMRGLALMGILLAAQAVAVLSVIYFAPESMFYFFALAPTLFCAIALAIGYDQRFALAAGGTHALLVTMSLAQPMGFFITLGAGVAISVRQLPDVRTRSKLVWVGIWTGLVMAAMVAVTDLVYLSLLIDGQFQRIGLTAIVVFITAFVTGLIAQALLQPIESFFQVTTSMTLKELNDASHPLLRKLVEQAPGTYQHSLRLADIAEAGAEAIGANGLLCRVGAMYHDIGKMNKPAYFIENQSDGRNRHDKLSPAMSLLIIVGHVKDGIEMAREYNLPRPIRHFIESHHGTTLVEYFYHAAKKQSEAEDAPTPTEFEFRYPGPKPQSREAAILMLCDGIESAARTLTDPTPTRLEQLVHRMAQKRLMDGQFDESNLTLQELHQIEVAVHKTLCAVYHARIAYPAGNKPAAPSPAPQRPSDSTAASA